MKIIVYGNPRPLQRPRLSRGRVYNPSSDDINKMKRILQQHVKKPLDGALDMHIAFYMPIAKSLPKKKQAERENAPHTSRPDLDNLIKLVCDAGNGILYHDDCQVVSLTATKCYGTDPQTTITVTNQSLSGFSLETPKHRTHEPTLLERF